PLAGCESQLVGIGELLAVEVFEEQFLGRVVVDMLARIDEAVAGAVLQRDPPLPARRARRRTRIRRQRAAPRAGNRHCAIAWQPVCPILVFGSESLADQQSA